jgi:hypothetical protein
MCVVACALLHRVSLWLVCDGAALRGIVSAVDCSYMRLAALRASQCRTAEVYEPTATATPCCKCCVCPGVGVSALDAAARDCGRVCNAALPLCTFSVTSTLSVQCSGVCSCGAVCLGVCVYVAL